MHEPPPTAPHATAGNPTAITIEQVRSTVKALMAALGEDPSLFGAHSLRIGGATAALTAGIHPSIIRLAKDPRVCPRAAAADPS